VSWPRCGPIVFRCFMSTRSGFWDPRIWRVKDLGELRPRIVRTEEFRMRKHEAIAAYHCQVTNMITGAGSAPLRNGFVRQFIQPEEIFFEVQFPD
jgi:hypothetical protein